LGVKKSYEDLDRVATWSHWTNNNFDIHLKEGVIKIIYLGGEKKGWLWVIPVSKDHLSIGVVLNNSYVKAQKQKFKDSENWKHDMYIQELKESFLFDSIIKDAKMAHKVGMAGDYSYYCEKKYGNNFALIGDAGAFLDPIFSSGIYVGMHSAELTGEAIYKKVKNTPDADQAMLDAYTEINGALKLLEKFIRLFYTPEALNFSTIGDPNEMLLYEKFESAYTIFHYLLAGDFFKNYEKYSAFIDVIKDQKSMVKFQNLINHNKDVRPESTCGENFEEMYGDMTHEIEFDHKA
jgi:flavin-dependent dehydrogenase